MLVVFLVIPSSPATNGCEPKPKLYRLPPDRVPTVQVIGYGLPGTVLASDAVLVHDAAPVTPDVARVSPFLNPEIVGMKIGLSVP